MEPLSPLQHAGVTSVTQMQGDLIVLLLPSLLSLFSQQEAS